MSKARNLTEVSMENSRMIRAMTFLCPNTNRVSIAKTTGLTFPVVTKNINEMISTGFIRETQSAHTRKGSGRIALDVEVNPDYGWALGIELGPYIISLSVINAAGEIFDTRIISKNKPNTYSELLVLLKAEISSEKKKHTGVFLGIGIASPGGNEDLPGILFRYDLPDWRGKPIEEDLKSEFDVPVVLMNNVTAMALYFNLTSDLKEGHYTFFYALRGIASVEFFHRENGLYNTVNRSGQVGHMILELNGEICPSCGNRGCLESISSEAAILKKCKENLSKNGEDSSNITMEDILSRRRKDPSFMKDIFDRAFLYLAIAISNIQNYCHTNKMFVVSRIIQTEDEFAYIEQVVRNNLLATKDLNVEFENISYDQMLGSRAAAFCFLYDQYVGIEQRLL